MNRIIAGILLVFLLAVVIVAVYDKVTGQVVIEESPCKIVKCRVRLFGFLETQAEQVGITPDGLVVCHCPYEPLEVVYLVSTYRKY